MIPFEPPPDAPQLYTPHELARAAGVPVSRVHALIAEGRILAIDDTRIPHGEAVRAGRALRAGLTVDAAHAPGTAVARAGALLATRFPRRQAHGLPVAISSLAHGLVVVILIVLAIPRLGGEATTLDLERDPPRLVYLSVPGPGGGGGGGGANEPKPAPAAMREGDSIFSSPMPEREAPPPPDPEPPEPPPPTVLPVRAPIVSAPAEARNRAGLLTPSASREETRGAGSEGGVGTGTGTGLGEGRGSGVGDGIGGGAGGGVYRPGSGVEPPRLIHEVRPRYTDEARRRSVVGEVLLEVVVSSDGRVGSARVLRGLGHGLDHEAAQAVRQWRFDPGRLKGTPVAVMVEVAVEFQLR